ncbi:hypothetical protein C8R44DRAFT_887547 [Mycena epipterygia]|nr:hypothetical protein C8R44DRAFT_887547 [Mycena epipterygia]
MSVTLATIPLDTQLEIIGWIPDFTTLHSCILVNHTFSQLFTNHRPSLTNSVAQNQFGEHLHDALTLVNTQFERCYSGPEHHGYESKLIRQLLSNENVVQEVEFIVLRFLFNNYKSMSEWGADARSPTPTELVRFKRAAYRFWIYCMVETSKRSWFLSQFPAIELAEVANLFYGVEAWVTELYTPKQLEFESEHEAVISNGLGRLSWLWKLFLAMIQDPGEETWDLFVESMGVSADCDGEGFFHYDLRECWKYRNIDIEYTQSILDEGHDRLEGIFASTPSYAQED